MTQQPMTSNSKYPLPDLVTQATAARMIGVARQNIPGFIARGQLEAVTVAGTVLVTKASAAKVAEERESRRSAAA